MSVERFGLAPVAVKEKSLCSVLHRSKRIACDRVCVSEVVEDSLHSVPSLNVYALCQTDTVNISASGLCQ